MQSYSLAALETFKGLTISGYEIQNYKGKDFLSEKIIISFSGTDKRLRMSILPSCHKESFYYTSYVNKTPGKISYDNMIGKSLEDITHATEEISNFSIQEVREDTSKRYEKQDQDTLLVYSNTDNVATFSTYTIKLSNNKSVTLPLITISNKPYPIHMELSII